ncbi:MAG: hypothetical protein ACUVQP_06875 [Bacteroidales bacterium]
MDLFDELRAIEEASQSFNLGSDDDIEYGYALAENIKSPSGTTYGLTVVNTNTNAAHEAKLFGFDGMLFTKIQNNPITITAQSGYGSYEKFLHYIWSNPCEILGVRITTTAAQINQMSWGFFKYTVFGKSDSNIVSVASYRTEQDYQSGVVTVPVKHVLDFDSYVTFNVLANTTVDLTLFIGSMRVLSKPIQYSGTRPILATKAGRVTATPRPTLIRPTGGAL